MEPPSNRVFVNHVLLDKILSHVVHDEWNEPTSDVRECRLVNKTWLESVTRTFWKSENPMFVFSLTELLSSRETSVLHNGHKLVQFMSSAMENLQLNERIPPHAISATIPRNQANTHKIIFDCLAKYGSGLIELTLRITQNTAPFPLNNNYCFPSLTNFSMDLFIGSSQQSSTIDMQDKIDFMQSVFHSSSKLREFRLSSALIDKNVPNSFGNLLFPSSLKCLDLRFQLNDRHFPALVNNSLPNLQTLQFFIGNSPAKDGLIASILKKYPNLETLHLHHTKCLRLRKLGPPTTLQLPCMKILKDLYIRNIYPSVKLPGYLQQHFPMLNRLTLRWQTRSMLRKWIENSCLPSVTYLKVSVVKDSDGGEEDGHIDVPTMQALHKAFQNVQELVVTPVDMTAFFFIMKEMRLLRCLQIRFHYESALEDSDTWDAALIGIPKESVAALRESPELWEGLLTGGDVSIRSLTALQTLKLQCAYEGAFPGISNMTFHYAFLKMPKLAELILKGGLWTTTEMGRTWESQGRTIEADLFEKDKRELDPDDERNICWFDEEESDFDDLYSN